MARHPHLFAGVLAAALGLGTLVGCTSSDGAAPSSAPSRVASSAADRSVRPARGPQPPAKGAWLGAAVTPRDDYSAPGRIRSFEEFERLTGRTLDVVHTYHPWHDPFPSEVDRHFLANGQQVLTGWAGSDCPGIAAGEYDDLIRQRAREVKKLGTPIMMAFRWEMDRPNLRAEVRSAKDYIAAWKRTRRIFEEESATNVGWVWAPTAKGFTGGYAQQYYPGDDQVDWIAVDAYTGPRLKPFAQVMRAFMTFARKHPDKPVMVAEFGLSDRDGRRPGWLRAAREYVKQNPEIKAVLYFNGNMEARETAQLALQPSATGKKAFHDWLADPYFNQRRRPVTEPR